mmetsp:Transcript_8459/g.24180  ORF Transcript_8459/g.24180 Transcript_8459/m.24180 type:complete len:130 (-) Transcript_8459:176-565(-)
MKLDLVHHGHQTQLMNNVLFLEMNHFLEDSTIILDKEILQQLILFVKMNMIKSMVLLVALMVSLKDGVLIVPPDSTDTVMITMVKVVLTSYVLSLILTLKVSTGEDVLQDKTLQLLLKKILPELHTLHL